MTNAEKYLKDGEDVDELVKELEDYIDKKYKEEYEWFHNVPLYRYLNDFFNIDLNKPIKPTLTEDERVILRNIDLRNFKAIGRKDDYLYLRYTDYCYDYGETDVKTLTFWYMYHDLFKFIKNGEEYSIDELLKKD